MIYTIKTIYLYPLNEIKKKKTTQTWFWKTDIFNVARFIHIVYSFRHFRPSGIPRHRWNGPSLWWSPSGVCNPFVIPAPVGFKHLVVTLTFAGSTRIDLRTGVDAKISAVPTDTFSSSRCAVPGFRNAPGQHYSRAPDSITVFAWRSTSVGGGRDLDDNRIWTRKQTLLTYQLRLQHIRMRSSNCQAVCCKNGFFFFFFLYLLCEHWYYPKP